MFRRRTSQLLLLIVSTALVMAACGGDDDASTSESTAATPTESTAATPTAAPSTSTAPTTPPGPPPTDYAGFRAQPTACGAEQPAERVEVQYPGPEDMDIDPKSRPVALISTSCGDITVELDPSIAPETVNSFVFLAESGYFDGTVSHRVAPGFVMQAGDPTATGRGGPGYVLPDEYPPADYMYERGVVAMANAGPGTTGSQFFIMLADAALPPQFSVFGRVTNGMEVLDTIAALPLAVGPSGERSTPLESVYLNSATIER